jgi:hypothetical protein
MAVVSQTMLRPSFFVRDLGRSDAVDDEEQLLDEELIDELAAPARL